MQWKHRTSPEFHLETKNSIVDDIFDTLSNKFNTNFRYIGQFFKEYIRGSQMLYPYLPPESKDYHYYDFHCHTIHSDGSPSHDQIVKFISNSNHLSGFATTDHLFHSHITDNGKTIRNNNEKVIHQTYSLLNKINNAKSIGKIPKNFLFIPGSVEFGIRVDPSNKKTAIEIIGLGLPEDFIERYGGIQKIKQTPAIELIEFIHDNSGIAIHTHPFYFNQGFRYPEIWKKCDAVEQFNHTCYFWTNPSIIPYYENFRDPLLLQNLFQLFLYFNWAGEAAISQLKISGTGSSDSHIITFYGAGATAFNEHYDNFDDLADAIQKQKGTPCLNPHWRPDFSTPRPCVQIYERWGKEFHAAIGNLYRNHKIAYKTLNFLVSRLSFFGKLHEKRRKNAFLKHISRY